MLSAFLAMGVMTFSLVLYGESFYIDQDDRGMKVLRGILQVALAIFSAPVFLLLGIPMLRGALLDLRAGLFRMDGLITLATLAAYSLSIWHTIVGEGAVYYETATMVLVLVMFGRRLEARARVQGSNAAALLADLLPDVAQRLSHGDTVTEIPIDDLARDDHVQIAPGDRVPADVRVLSGNSAVTSSHITGEFTPREVERGDEIPAGSINGTGTLTAVVVATAKGGSFERIRRLLDRPLDDVAAFRVADRMAGYLGVMALLFAVVGCVWAAQTSDSGAVISVLLSTLLVACPCSLGLATPLAYRAARATLARGGILVHDGAALEKMADINRVLLDKTGTLTLNQGKLALAEGTPLAFQRLGCLVGHSNHHLSLAAQAGTTPPDALKVTPGRGVEGEIEGTLCRAGSPRWMDELGQTWSTELTQERHELGADGATMVAVAWDGRVQGIAFLEQRLADGARATLSRLKQLSLHPQVISGDHSGAVSQIGEQTGIEAFGEMTPEMKVEFLRQRQDEGEVVMAVGDGLNDAPFLQQADVGVVVSGATEATRSRASVELLRDDLLGLTRLIEVARRLRKVVRGNMLWAVAYNLVALTLAASGRLHPLAAVVLMILSSLVVSYRSYGLLTEADA